MSSDDDDTPDPKGPVPPSSATILPVIARMRKLLADIGDMYAALEHEAYSVGAASLGTYANIDQAQPDLRVVNLAVDRTKHEMRSALLAASKQLGRAVPGLAEAARILDASSPTSRDQPKHAQHKARSLYRWTPEDVAKVETRSQRRRGGRGR